MSGGLIWLGIGLALAPVEAIRRRVDAIAAQDLSERVPVTGGDDEIARMARTLNAMLDRLESSSRFQQEFVSNASHELRSPLATLLATVERAESDQSNANWPEVAGTIMREGRRLDTIIDGLFWLARHDENQIDVTSVDVDLDDLLFEESQRVRSISGLNVDTSAVQPTRVVGDLAMLKRMIRNVVDNAARYAVSELRFGSRYDGPYAVVTVSDDGEGVDVAESARFFERFVRADPARQPSVRRHGPRAFDRDRYRHPSRGLGAFRRGGERLDDRASRALRVDALLIRQDVARAREQRRVNVMNSDDLSEVTALPIQIVGMSFYFDPLTAAKAQELGLNVFQYYGLGRGGVLGDVELGVLNEAFTFFHPASIARMWGTPEPKADPVATAAAYLESAYEFITSSSTDTASTRSRTTRCTRPTWARS